MESRIEKIKARLDELNEEIGASHFEIGLALRSRDNDMAKHLYSMIDHMENRVAELNSDLEIAEKIQVKIQAAAEWVAAWVEVGELAMAQMFAEQAEGIA